MLSELRISGLGVIDDAVIEPAPGFTVVTGETGAGKTMIVTALGLVCGGRADSDRVRAGAKRAVVEARFVGSWRRAEQPGARGVGSPAASRNRPRSAAAGGAVEPDTASDATGAVSGSYLAEVAESVGGDVDDDGSLLAVRSVSADGRSRGHIGGRSVPVSALGEFTEPLVAIHGQSEAMTLLQHRNQRGVLDRFAGVADQIERYRQLRQEWLALRREIADRTGRARERAQREQVLRLGLTDIRGADPQPGEDDAIAAEVRRLGDADALRSLVHEALGALVGVSDAATIGDEVSAAALVHAAVRHLESAPDPALSARLGDLRSASTVLVDVAADLSRYLADLDSDPGRLAGLLERQALLRGLVRRYGEDVDAVLAWARQAEAELAGLDSSEDALAALRARSDETESRLAAAAAAVTEQRVAAADRLGRAATAELAHLAMSGASLRVAVRDRVATRDDADAVTIGSRRLVAGPDGVDEVEIVLRARPGAPELPVARAASGGELSRVMLALEVVLAGADPVATLVFDEVDAGVGGRAATEIGRQLAMLAGSHQVIVVTHLAQVAAFADRHFTVEAAADGIIGVSGIRRVEGPQRQAELARMLGGTDGDIARAHAADLLAAARR